MPFDKPTRNALARLVAAARNRLIEDLTAQLQSDFRLQPDGTALPLDGLTDAQRAAAEDLRELLDHYRAALPAGERQPGKASFDRLVREIGFTVLNRLAALRLGEERGLVVQCVGQGLASEGFQLYARLTGGALGSGYSSYRAFLYNLFDELAVELGALFDTRTPLSQVFPTERALLDVLDLLNTPNLAWIWREDETIGWIYQYYNDEAERKKMRDESQAPRSSRELAVRNQFFTPRYVVEFLADNTLGRLWYEMRAGDTRLAEECKYLVRQPVAEGAALPAHPKKDPRHITMLDPAGGSGHFGLYCFDLFETIYAEAWDDPELGPALREDHPNREAFARAVPRLILAHNIHIIDIDPRAVQIAALALWLRAQRSYQRLGLRAADRPRITRVNVVTAEPMPGDRALLDEFVAGFRPTVLGDLVRVVFDKMQLAGEAGSLLKIEDELRDAIARAKQQWLAGDRAEQLALLPDERHAPRAEQLAFDVSGISVEAFWDEAEARVLEALRAYAEHAGNGHATRRQLFAQDTAQGFAFIELCRHRYEVVLMNPPYGDVSIGAKAYLQDTYSGQPNDLFACFLERVIDQLAGQMIGALTSRTFLNYSSFARLRERYIFGQTSVTTVADLGFGVLDAAMVETCASVFELTDAAEHESLFVRIIDSDSKANSLLNAVDALRSQREHPACFWINQRVFTSIDGMPMPYWAGRSILSRLLTLPSVYEKAADIRLGVVTGDNDQFLRLRWEVEPGRISPAHAWATYSKGGDYSKYYSDIQLLIDWRGTGKHIAETLGAAVRLRELDQYLKPGLTYPLVTVKGVNLRALPAGCVFDNTCPAAFPYSGVNPYLVLGVLNSRVSELYVRCFTSSRHWQVGYMRRIPWPDFRGTQRRSIADNCRKAIELARTIATIAEPNAEFVSPGIVSRPAYSDSTLRETTTELAAHLEHARESFVQLDAQINSDVTDGYKLSPYELTLVDREVPPLTRERDQFSGLINANHRYRIDELVSYLAGLVFGRWDIRIGENRELAPKLQDVFESLPVCSPGMLVGHDGLPATPGNIVSEAWLRARPNAITLPPEGSVAQPTISDAEYPLRIAWDGILVDDPGLDRDREDPYPADIVRRVRETLGVLWGERAGAIEQEAAEILGVHDLREYFRKPGYFFAIT